MPNLVVEFCIGPGSSAEMYEELQHRYARDLVFFDVVYTFDIL